jgi:hypothetical protein
MEQLGIWYNGYRFSEVALKVYNPFSVLYCLKDQKLSNYWFESGTPFFLLPLLKKQYTSLQEVAEFEISPSSTDKGRIDAVLSMPDRIYIFELKLHSSADDVLQQILEKQYYQRFLTQYKPLTLVGLSFGPTAHKLTVTYVAQEMHTVR